MSEPTFTAKPAGNCTLPGWFDQASAQSILSYGQRLAARHLLMNTLGNIAVRHYSHHWRRDVIYTKHLGLSLEECGLENIVVLDLHSDELLHGTARPSQGHRMHREILCRRPDINATVHLHPNEVVAFFSVMRWRTMKYVSNDTALVMGKPPCILGEGVNIELDIQAIARCVADTNCIVMPGHGITSLGRNLSEAFHRALAFTAEVGRLIISQQLSAASGCPVAYADEDDVQRMYREGQNVIYGGAGS